MDGKQRQSAVDVDQNTTELVTILPRNPYCSNEGTHCGCRLSHVAFQPQLVTAKPWSLWKTFLVCLLACLIAIALVVLVLYFVHFDKPLGTTIIIHADGKTSHVTCMPSFTPSPASSSLSGSQGTLPSTPVADQSSPTIVPPSTMEMTKTTEEHEVIIEDA